MVRNYLRKRVCPYTQGEMACAIRMVLAGQLSQRAAAVRFSIPQSSLHSRLQPGKHEVTEKTLLSRDNEQALVNFIKEFEQRGFGLTLTDVRMAAFDLLKTTRPQSLHKINAMAALNHMMSYDWWAGFQRRHPSLGLKMPQALSIARMVCLTKPTMDKFYATYLELITRANVLDKPRLIYNCDETGLTLVPGSLKVVGTRGISTPTVTGGERGELITVLACMSAGGEYIPPALIYKGKRLNPALSENLPPGTLVKASDSGYIKTDIFLTWLDHFAAHMRMEVGCKTVLVLDGHDSHTKSIAVLEKARALNIELIALPSHTTHVAQPCDKTLFAPLKKRFKEGVRREQFSTGGGAIPRVRFPKIFCEAWYLSATILNALSGFSSTGLYPFNNGRIANRHFIANNQTPLAPDGELADQVPDTPESELQTETPNLEISCTTVPETPPSSSPKDTSQAHTPGPLTPLTAPAPLLTAPAPLLTAPAPLLTAPAPILTAPAPLLTAPAPLLTAPAPILTAPAPILTASAPLLTASAPLLTASVLTALSTVTPPTAPLMTMRSSSKSNSSPHSLEILLNFKPFPTRKPKKAVVRDIFKAGGKVLTDPGYIKDLATHQEKMKQKKIKPSTGAHAVSAVSNPSDSPAPLKIINRKRKSGKQKKIKSQKRTKQDVDKEPLLERDDPKNFCGYCEGNYFDDEGPDVEVWYQCILCNRWFHQSCTNWMSRGIDLNHFTCMNCDIDIDSDV